MGVAVVTGAGSGLGRSIALALLEAGWQVALPAERVMFVTRRFSTAIRL